MYACSDFEIRFVEFSLYDQPYFIIYDDFEWIPTKEIPVMDFRGLLLSGVNPILNFLDVCCHQECSFILMPSNIWFCNRQKWKLIVNSHIDICVCSEAKCSENNKFQTEIRLDSDDVAFRMESSSHQLISNCSMCWTNTIKINLLWLYCIITSC